MLRPACCIALGLGALLTTPAQGASPYPPSTAITDIRWDTGSYRWTGLGGDIWPVTWAADGSLVTAWGDGVVGCREKASYGVAAIATDLPSTTLATRHCGPGPQNRGKMMTLLAAGGLLYARMAPQSTGSGYPIWRSADGGRSWAKPSAPLSFPLTSFVQFGKDNAGAPGGYVYALETRGGNAIHLLRVAPGSAQAGAAYEYFSGTSTKPDWTRSRSASRAVFIDPAGALRPSITYNPELGRYLLVVAHSKIENPSSDRMGLFEASSLWGPWRTVMYVDNFLGMPGGHFLGMSIPIKWQADGGRTIWAVFSCHNQSRAGSCGQYHDRFNLMKATLTVNGGQIGH